MASPVIGTPSTGRVNGASLTISHNSDGNPLYVTVISAIQISTVTYNGSSLRNLSNRDSPQNTHHYQSVWSLASPGSGTANVVITPASSGGMTAGAFNVSGGPADGGVCGRSWLYGKTNGVASTSRLVVPSFQDGVIFAMTDKYTSLVSFALTGAGTSLWAQNALSGADIKSAAAWANCSGGNTDFSWAATVSGSPSTGEWSVLAFIIPDGSISHTGGSGQLWIGQIPAVLDTTPAFAGVPNPGQGELLGWSSSSGVMLANGTLRNMYWKLPVAPGAGTSRTFTIWRNHIATALAVTVADTNTEASLTGVDVPVYKGDYVFIAETFSGSPGSISGSNGYPHFGIEFESAIPGLSVYGSNTHISLSSDSTPQNSEIFQGLFWGHCVSWANPAGLRRNVVSAPGTVIDYAVEYQTETTRVFEFYLYKNDVKQDGTGGTPNTLIVMTGTGRMERESARLTVNMRVAVGDYVYVGCNQTSAEVGTNLRMHVASTFLADEHGVFLLGGFSNVNAQSSTEYCSPTNGDSGFGFSEALAAVKLGPTTRPLQISTIAASVGTAPGIGKSRTITVRKNSTTPADAPSAVVSGASLVGSDGGTAVGYSAGDLISVQHAPAGIPANTSTITWGMSGSIFTSAIPGGDACRHQVVEYIGDGTSDRLIPTDFPLDDGVVAVTIYPVLPAGVGTATPPVVRTSADTASWLDGFGGTSANFITGFTGSGFTVGPGDAFGKVNDVGVKYIAVVICDTTVGNNFLKVGTYTGNGADNRNISILSGWQPTHVWVHGVSHVYRSSDFTGDSSVTLRSGVAGADMIQGFYADGFQVGTHVNVNQNGQPRGYIALRATASLLASGFASFKMTGTAAADDAVTGFGFQPGFCLAKQYDAGEVAYYKSTTFPSGDDSQGWNSSNDTGTAVKSLDADGVTLGSAVAADTKDVYGFAWKDSTDLSAFTIQKVTQFVAQIGLDEDVEDDPPPSTSPCTGGGTVVAGTNPGAGNSLATASRMRKWVEVTIGGTPYYWSDIAINQTVAKQPIVLSWGKTARGLTDGQGGMETGAVTIRLSDYNRVLRGLHSTQVMLNKVATIKIADFGSVDSNAWTLFTGVIRDFRPESELTYRLVLEDALTLASSASFAQEKLVPTYLITTAITDRNIIERIVNTPMQECYGSLSDEDEDVPIGTVVASFLEAVTLTGFEYLGNIFHFVVCLGASAGIQSVFLADPSSGDPPTARAKAGASEYGTRIFCPFQAGWLYPGNYYNLSSGGRRFTSIFVTESHPGAELARSGKIPMVVNLCGRETVGDATGSTIDSLPLQLLHHLNNRVVQDATANWLAQKALGTYSLFDTTSFGTVKTRSEARITGGYKGATVLGHGFKQITLRDEIAQFCQSGDFDLGQNRFGQIMLTMLDRTSTASTATTFTDANDIIKDSFSIDPKTDEVENRIRYVYKRKYVPELQQLAPAEGTRLPGDEFNADWFSGLKILDDTTSQSAVTGIGEIRESQLIEFEMVRDPLTAADVAAQRLALRKTPRAVAVFDTTIPKAANVELGDIIKVTHFQGLGATGWTDRRLQVRRIEVDLSTLLITLTCRDVHDLLA